MLALLAAALLAAVCAQELASVESMLRSLAVFESAVAVDVMLVCVVCGM